MAQQLRNATPFGEGPEFIIRDRDSKFGADFDRVAVGAGTRVIKCPVRSPLVNATCERFLGSVRRECLDHIIILGTRHLESNLGEYVAYFNASRPHQGLKQRIPVGSATVEDRATGAVTALPVLGGLHYDTRVRGRRLTPEASRNIISCMRRDSRLSGVLHVLLHMAQKDGPVTSEVLAKAMDTNPVVLRRVMAGLRDQGYVQSEKGHGGGWTLACDLAKVTLRDVYAALGSPSLLAIGNRMETPGCVVEEAVNAALRRAFEDAESLLLSRLGEVKLATLSEDVRSRLAPRGRARPSGKAHPHGEHGAGPHDHEHLGHHHQLGGHHDAFADADALTQVLDDPTRDEWQRPDEVLRALELKPSMLVADVGAGTGYFAVRLARAVPRCEVIATDLQPEMVRFLNERARGEQLPNLRAVLATPTASGLVASGVDRILVVHVWHHLAQGGEYARGLAAALKPRGRLFVVDFTLTAQRGPPVSMRVAPEAVIGALKSAGLSAKVSTIALPDQYIVEARRRRRSQP